MRRIPNPLDPIFGRACECFGTFLHVCSLTGGVNDVHELAVIDRYDENKQRVRRLLFKSVLRAGLGLVR